MPRLRFSSWAAEAVRAPMMIGSVARRAADRSAAGRLEELDRVARGILEQDLPTPRAADDVVAERQARALEPRDVGGDVLDDEVDAVPSAGPGRAAVRHRSAGRALGPAEQEPEVAAYDVRERRCGAAADREREVGGVEVDRRLDVVDHVADADELVRHLRSPPGVFDRLDEKADARGQLGRGALERGKGLVVASGLARGVGDAPVDQPRPFGGLRADLAHAIAEA